MITKLNSISRTVVSLKEGKGVLQFAASLKFSGDRIEIKRVSFEPGKTLLASS